MLPTYSRNHQTSIEREGYLPCSQDPVTGHCPEAEESSPHTPILEL
jgi:hypothetical protein